MIEGLPAGAAVRVWIPMPLEDAYQRVQDLPADVPCGADVRVDPVHGNRMLFFAGKAPPGGKLRFRMRFDIERRSVDLRKPFRPAEELPASERQRYLQPARLVPLRGRPAELFFRKFAKDDLPDSPGKVMARARRIFDEVRAHVEYDKSRPGYGRGDAAWVCDSRYGNCTDFHSLFLSWCRLSAIPAQFEIGFALPEKASSGELKGYHCWAWFHVDDRGWVPVDVSEADKHPKRAGAYFARMSPNYVAFSTGRDVDLEPPSRHGPVNFFIRPHVEVGGNVWPQARIAWKVAFENRSGEPCDGTR